MEGKANNNRVYCCVSNCRSRRMHLPEVSFHRFPRADVKKVLVENESVDIRQAWISKLRMQRPVSKYMVVCSKHFTKDDYFWNKTGQPGPNKRNRLKNNAVPTQNLPSDPSTNEITEGGADVNIKDLKCPRQEVPTAQQLLISCEIPLELVPKLQTVCDSITTDNQLNCLTGLNGFEMLNTIQYYVGNVSKDTRIRERIILTFAKLKNDLSYGALSTLFGIAPQTCELYFLSMIDVLSVVLKPLIFFLPSKHVHMVLDCIEISLQTTKCLHCRINMYSHYKSSNTVKFMVGLSPAGLVTFVSRGYGGRTPDKTIFEQSNFIRLLEPNRGAIVVDNGFLIGQICDQYGIELIRPPKQLEEAEVDRCGARVQAERVNRRIKRFKMLSNELAFDLVSKVDEIFTIICAICNMSNPRSK